MNAAHTTAIETALFAIGSEFRIESFRVIETAAGQTVVWALCDVSNGKGSMIGWDGGADLLFLTKRARPVGEIMSTRTCKGARVVQDWTAPAA
jgi:hypothetical protein